MAADLPIDKGWAWMILLGSHICLLFLIGGYKCLGILFVEFQELFGATSAKTALIMGLIPGGMSLLSPFSTVIGEWTSFRRVSLVGGFICSLGIFLTAFAPNMTYVILIFGLFTGIGYGLVFSPSIIVVGQYFHRRRTLANGLAFAGGSIGQLIIPIVLRGLTDMYGFRGAMMIYGALTLNILVGAALFRPLRLYPKLREVEPDIEISISPTICDYCHKPKYLSDTRERPQSIIESNSLADSIPKLHPNSKDEDIKSITSSNNSLHRQCRCQNEAMYTNGQYTSTGSLYFMQDPPQPAPMTGQQVDKMTTPGTRNAVFLDRLSTLFCNPLYVLWIIGICVGNAGYVNSVVFLPPYLAQMGVSKYMAAITLSVAGVCDLVGRIAGGWLGDLNYIRRHNLMAVCMILTALSSLLFSQLENFGCAMFYAVVVGLLGGSYIAMMAVVLVDFIGLEKLPMGFGLGVFFMGLFNVPTPALLGMLKDYTGGYSQVYIVCTVLMALCAVSFTLSNIILYRRKHSFRQ